MLSALPLADAELYYDPHFLTDARADALLAQLHAEINWESHRIKLFGREFDSPRLSCWIGDAGASYVYSGTRFEPRPWPEALSALRDEVSQTAGERFNSVLANLYRDGRDSMGWHSDNEPELGERPVIASLSLGAERRFVFKTRHGDGQSLALALPHGSLLVMHGHTQRNYRHALPKTAKPVGERINLTFRRILARAPVASTLA